MSEPVHDWIPVAQVPQLLPSCRPGRKLALSTVYRWIARGQLDCCRRGRWRFVRRDQVLGMMQPAQPDREPSRLDRAMADAWTESTLRRFGLIG